MDCRTARRGLVARARRRLTSIHFLCPWLETDRRGAATKVVVGKEAPKPGSAVRKAGSAIGSFLFAAAFASLGALATVGYQVATTKANIMAATPPTKAMPLADKKAADKKAAADKKVAMKRAADKKKAADKKAADKKKAAAAAAQAKAKAAAANSSSSSKKA